MKRALFVISIILAVIAFIAPVATAQLVYQVATNQGSSSLCLNRQGGTATNVITYSCNDENDDFSILWLGGMCNGTGYVTSTCPFSSSTVNSRYRGAAIVEVYNYNFALCLASNGGNGILGACPDVRGNGGSYGTIFVLAQVHNFPDWTGTPSTYVVNRYFTNLYGSPRWMCSLGRSVLVALNSPQGLLGTCQWREVRLPGITQLEVIKNRVTGVGQTSWVLHLA